MFILYGGFLDEKLYSQWDSQIYRGCGLVITVYRPPIGGGTCLNRSIWRVLGSRTVSVEDDGSNRVDRAKDSADGNVWWAFGRTLGPHSQSLICLTLRHQR